MKGGLKSGQREVLETKVLQPLREGYDRLTKTEKKLAEDTKKLTDEGEKAKKLASEKIAIIEKKRDEDVKKGTEEIEKLKTKTKEKVDQLKTRMADEDKKAEAKAAEG